MPGAAAGAEIHPAEPEIDTPVLIVCWEWRQALEQYLASLLYLLASRGGQVVSRDDILDAIWGTDFVCESNVVDRHIRSLRIKLQNDYRHPRFIASVPGRGYRFLPTFSIAGWAGEGDTAHGAPA